MNSIYLRDVPTASASRMSVLQVLPTLMNISTIKEIFVLSLVSSFCLWGCGYANAQRGDTDWQRVVTENDFVVDIDPSSLRLEAGGIASARFRTVLSKAEALQGDSGTKYKIRTETVEFKIKDRSYRSSEISLLDSKGKVVQTSIGTPARNWKPLTTSGRKWFAALEGLRPFNLWTVISYRAPNDTGKGAPELDKLIGSRVSLALDVVSFGNNRCSSPAYESKKFTTNDLEKLLGTSMKDLDVPAGDVDVIVLRCETTVWQPGQTLVIPITPDRMFMLWEGALLELLDKNPKPLTLPGIKIS